MHLTTHYPSYIITSPQIFSIVWVCLWRCDKLNRLNILAIIQSSTLLTWELLLLSPKYALWKQVISITRFSQNSFFYRSALVLNQVEVCVIILLWFPPLINNLQFLTQWELRLVLGSDSYPSHGYVKQSTQNFLLKQ